MTKQPSSRSPTIDPRRLIELLHIAQCGSFTKAAETQGVSQPALSRSISILERSLGIQLLERTRNGANLTKSGSQLVFYAEALEALLARAAEDIRRHKAGLQGSVVIGVSPIACADLVPEVVVRLNAVSPGISVTIDQGPDDVLLAKLRSSELDLMVSPLGIGSETADIVREVLLPDSLIVVTRAGGPWSHLRNASLCQFSGAHWVMPSPNTVMWQNIQSLFAAENVSWPEDCTISNSILAIKSLVMRSDFVTISSRELMKLEIEAGQLACVGLDTTGFVRQICVRLRRDAASSPVIGRVLDLLRGVAAEMRAPTRKAYPHGRTARSSKRVGLSKKSRPRLRR